MEKNSRKNEENIEKGTGSENKEHNTAQPIKSGSRTPGVKSENAAGQTLGDRESEVARDPEGRPGSFGIDDF
ncbi:hypothetical protein [Adhaeribacter aerolatus]|nr:hypothetical protein [Adhaeribacter aerolatus]